MKPHFRRPSLGLALGGGGARGLAHIGILKVLEQENIPIDCMSGTSMGGIITAAYAVGHSMDDLKVEAIKMGELPFMLKLVDWELPVTGLLAGSRIEEYLAKQLGKDTTFESLPIPIALTAVDVYSAKEIVFSSGNLIDGVRATMALPGVVEPLQKEGQLLVDGGVLNNVPADLVRKMGAEIVIAVDVSLDIHDQSAWDNMGMPKFALHKWRTSTITIAALTEANMRQAKPELILRPKILPGITTITGFRHAAEIIAAGENAAREALPQIRQLTKATLHFQDKMPHRLT